MSNRVIIGIIVLGFILIALASTPPAPQQPAEGVVDRIKAGCATEFPNDPDNQTQCVTQIVTKRLIQDHQDRMERAGNY